MLSALAVLVLAQAPGFVPCTPYPQSPLYRPRVRQVPAGPSTWIQAIEGALDGDEILLADGNYALGQYAVQITRSITVRGASGNRDAVRIQGQGYAVDSEGFMVHGSDVTIADLTIWNVRDHAISLKGESGVQAPHVYNVHLYDIGTQHVKATPGGIHAGVVACSRLGYTPGGVRGDYIDAIDVHQGIDWIVRDNEIYNHWGDGSGCEVDVNCGTYEPGGGPAILFWNNSSGTMVERNRILDSFRGIALGFGSPHAGGVVRNNFFYQSEPGRPGVNGWIPGDMGIQVDRGSGTAVDHNTVILGGTYPGPIEVWNSASVAARNNLLTRPVWDRGGNSGLVVLGNKADGTVSDLAAPGNPHLAAGSTAVDFAASVDVPAVTADIDGDSRPQGPRRDAGCDELVDRIFMDGFDSVGPVS